MLGFSAWLLKKSLASDEGGKGALKAPPLVSAGARFRPAAPCFPRVGARDCQPFFFRWESWDLALCNVASLRLEVVYTYIR